MNNSIHVQYSLLSSDRITLDDGVYNTGWGELTQSEMVEEGIHGPLPQRKVSNTCPYCNNPPQGVCPTCGDIY